MKDQKILPFGSWFKVYEQAGRSFKKSQQILETEAEPQANSTNAPKDIIKTQFNAWNGGLKKQSVLEFSYGKGATTATLKDTTANTTITQLQIANGKITGVGDIVAGISYTDMKPQSIFQALDAFAKSAGLTVNTNSLENLTSIFNRRSEKLEKKLVVSEKSNYLRPGEYEVSTSYNSSFQPISLSINGGEYTFKGGTNLIKGTMTAKNPLFTTDEADKKYSKEELIKLLKAQGFLDLLNPGQVQSSGQPTPEPEAPTKN